MLGQESFALAKGHDGMEEPFGFTLGHTLLDMGWPANLHSGIDGIADIGLSSAANYSLIRVAGPLGVFKKVLGSVGVGANDELVVRVFGRENEAEMQAVADELTRRLGRPSRVVLASE